MSFSKAISRFVYLGLLLALPGARADLLLQYTFDEASGPALDTGTAPAADGTLTGQATRIANTPSGNGSALNLNFSGAGNYVSCGNPDKLNNLTNLTLAVWMNLQGNPAGNDRLMDKISTNGGFGWAVNNASASGMQTRFLANSTSGGAAATSNVNASNRWVFLAMTYDGTVATNNVLFYSGTTNTAVTQLGSPVTFIKGPITNTPNELRVGSTPASTADRTPPVWYDNVRVYNTVLSQSDLEAIRAADVPNSPAQVVVQPANQAVYDGFKTATFTATVGGSEPVYKQWYFNATNVIADATNASLTLTNVTAASVGNYSIFVSNVFTPAGVWSSNATLTLIPLPNTPQTTNIWNLYPGDRPYITSSTANNERGLAFRSVSTNLLLVSRVSSPPSVVVLDGQTGAEKSFLDATGVLPDQPGVMLGLSTIAAADDGMIFAGNLTVSANSPSYILYAWLDETPGVAPGTVFIGDPGFGVLPNLRWGDNLAVRGAGANTQILLAPGSGTNVVLLRTQSGFNFQTEIPPAMIAISGVPSAFAQGGTAFGPGTNTFWAKSAGQQLYLVQFDLNSNTGAVLRAYSTASVPGSVRGISTDPAQRWLGGVSLEIYGDNARLYDISDLDIGPVLADQELFPTRNANITVGGTASTAIGGNYFFALDSNNGIKAFLIDTNFHSKPVITLIGDSVITNEVNTPFVDPGAVATENGTPLAVVVTGSVNTNLVGAYVLTYTTTDPARNTASTNRTVYVVASNIPFSVTRITAGAAQGVVLTWQSRPGHVYQVEARGDLAAGSWSNISGDVTATGDTCSYTNNLSGQSQFYRVKQ